MTRLQLEGSAGTLIEQPVRFCSVCCRFNPLPGSLCPTCRDTRSQVVVAPSLGTPLRRRVRYVLRILAGFVVFALIASALVAGTSGAIIAVAFYLGLGALALAFARSFARHDRCEECRRRGLVAGGQPQAGPGVPLVVGADDLHCSSCGADLPKHH